MTPQLNAIVSALEPNIKQSGSYYLAKCPYHNGTKHSVQIGDGDKGRVRITCHSHNCDPKDIMESIGLQLSDLFYEPLTPYQKKTYNKIYLAKKALYELQVLALALNDISKNKETDLNRAMSAWNNIKNIDRELFL